MQQTRTSPAQYATPKAILRSERFQQRIKERAKKRASLVDFNESNIIFETGRVIIPQTLGVA